MRLPGDQLPEPLPFVKTFRVACSYQANSVLSFIRLANAMLANTMLAKTIVVVSR
jgi:hypothetical protein